MPQLMPLYWCFSVFMLLYIFIMMVIVYNENMKIEKFYLNQMKFLDLNMNWMW